MQFIILTRRNADRFRDEEFQAVRDEETRRVQELYMASQIRQIWCREDIRGVAMLIEAATPEEARGIFGSLPMAAAGMIALDALIPLTPYYGFAQQLLAVRAA